MSLTKEQLTDLTAFVNDRLGEFDEDDRGPFVFERKSRGETRLLYEAIMEWTKNAEKTAWENTPLPDGIAEYLREMDERYRKHMEGLNDRLGDAMRSGLSASLVERIRQNKDVPCEDADDDKWCGDDGDATTVITAEQLAADLGRFIDHIDNHRDEVDDDPAELAAAWPDMPDLTGGMISRMPVSVADLRHQPESVTVINFGGDLAPESEPINESSLKPPIAVAELTPPKGDEKLTDTVKEAARHPDPMTQLWRDMDDAIKARTAATLGPEHTIITPLKPIGRLPDPNTARENLATALAAGGSNGLRAQLAKPRTLAEMDELPVEMERIVAALQGMAIDGVMPAIAFWDRHKPDGLPKWATIMQRHNLISWKQLREKTGLLPPNSGAVGLPVKTTERVVKSTKRGNVLPTREQVVAELKRQAMGGVTPSMAQFDDARPANWATAAAQTLRLNTTWGELAAEAGLKRRPANDEGSAR